MIQAKISKNPKILLVFDKPQSAKWIQEQRIGLSGIEAFMHRFMSAGVNIVDDVSAVCLSDSMNPKAPDFTEKQDYITEFIETYAFNLVIPVGAAAFDKMMGFKGAEKYFEKLLHCEKYNCKTLPCPLPSMIKFKPEIAGVLNNTVKIAKEEMEFSEIKAEAKIPTYYHVIKDIPTFNKFIEVFSTAGVFAFDLEATGFQHNVDEILTIQFTHKVGYSYLIPTDYYNKTGFGGYWTPDEWGYITSTIKSLFATATTVIGHNIKFDLKFINYWWNIPIPRATVLRDTLAMSFLVDENTPNDLKYQACVNTDLGDYERELEDWKKEYVKRNKIKVSEFSYAYVPFDILIKYALIDTDATFRLWLMLKERIKEEEQEHTLGMLMRFTYTTCRMELNGWPCDIDYAKSYLEELNYKIEAAEAELKKDKDIGIARNMLAVTELAKENAKRKNKIKELPYEFEFNLGSNHHKRVLFFTVLGLPVVKYTKARDENGKRTTPSTDKEVMEKWGFDHPKIAPLLDAIRNYNELCKMKSTYVESIINKSVNGRIYPIYNVCGAKTGRLSSKNPKHHWGFKTR